MRKLVLGVSFLVWCWGLGTHVQAASPLTVGAEGMYPTIEAALAQAQAGDTIEVDGGVYPTPLLIDKSVTLRGIHQPVIDGEGQASLITITAPDVTIEGFIIRNTGSSMPNEDTAIISQAPNTLIQNNRLENTLYGIYFSNAPGGIARHNVIIGQPVADTMRGDSIRAWYSHDIQIVDNDISLTRDILLTYSDNAIITDNQVHNNRYGLHFMYSSGMTVANNTFEDNSVGSFMMYSHNITISQNTFAYSTGSSGYGLALKDMDSVMATENVFVGNVVGLYLDNSPSLYDATNTFQGNIFAYNHEGVVTLPSVERNTFQANAFLGNTQQAAMRGREMTSRNSWSANGQGNYWSDYVGYDSDGDGVGDLTYRVDRLFESLADQYPVLQLFHYSPIAQVIDLGGAAFPVLRPTPLLTDEAPLLTYTLPPQARAPQHTFSASFLGIGIGLISLVVGLYSLALRPLPLVRRPLASTIKEETMITVEHLTKQYGSIKVLDNLSFKVQPGEALALWGDNGAGKTTTLLCLLGIHPFEGNIQVNGINVRQESKLARRTIGYIPQEVKFYDMSVRDNLLFYARLKQVPQLDVQAILAEVGLAEQQDKAVNALSGGMKQRLALAIGLLGDPPVLLLDESTANLDVQARREFLTLVQRLNQAGKTIVFTTHRLEEVTALAQRVLVLKQGRIEHDCPPSELPHKLDLHKWLRIYVPSTQREEAMSLLRAQGYNTQLNTSAFYVNVTTQGKMFPLRLLESAQIAVQDFDLVDNHSEVHHD